MIYTHIVRGGEMDRIEHSYQEQYTREDMADGRLCKEEGHYEGTE